MLTLKQILDDVVSRGGYTRPSDYANSDVQDAQQLVALANQESAELLRRFYWPQLRKVWELTLTSDELYDLPTDWGPPVPDTAWSQNRNWASDFPTSDTLWAYLKSQINFSGIRHRMRLRNGQLEVNEPDVGDILRFEYTSKYPINGRTKDRFTADTDTFDIDDELLIRGITWRHKKLKSAPDWQIDQAEYRSYLNMIRSESTGSQTIRTCYPEMEPINPPYADTWK